MMFCKFGIRKEIEVLFFCGHSADQIKGILDQKHGKVSPSLRTVQRWIREVKWGNKELKDSPRCGRPVCAATSGNVERVLELIKENPKYSTRKLGEMLGIGKSSVQKILRDDLDMQRMNCRWTPKTLTQAQKDERVRCCRDVLSVWENNWTELVERVITCDETWVFYENPHDRVSGSEWRKKGSRPPELPKLRSNQKKIMASVFWDCKGIVHIDVLEKGSTVNSDRYCSLLTKVREEIKAKRRGKLGKGIILLDDNARPHRSKETIKFLKDLKWTSLPHPPYSPDLAPSDFHLFRHLKKFLKGKCFTEEIDLRTSIEQFFTSKSSNFFLEPFTDLKNRLTKCIELRGEYL